MKYCKDPIPNVKFCVAKLLKKIMPKMDTQTVMSKVKPVLNEMAGDADKDVAYYAKVAVNSC
jgi:serine/threonine-protein phosphatase 2A regulatory subunit A